MENIARIIGRYWEALFIADPSRPQLILLSAVALLALLIFGGIFGASILKCRHGIIGVFLGLLFPLGLYLTICAVGEIYLLEHLVKYSFAQDIIIGIGIAGTLMFGVGVSRWLMGTSWSGALAAIVMVYAASYGSAIIIYGFLESVTSTTHSLESHKDRGWQL